MRLDSSHKILKIERIRTADNQPVVYCLDHLGLKYLENGISKRDFQGSLFKLLENKYGIFIKYALTHIVPYITDKSLAEKLDIKEKSPLLLLEQYHYDTDERMILFSQNYFRSDQFQFKVLRKR